MIHKLAILLFFLSPFSLFSQNQSLEKEENNNKTISSSEENNDEPKMRKAFNGAWVSVSGGMNYYFGDIAPYQVLPRTSQFNEQVRSAFKVSLGKNIKWGLGAQVSFQKGSLIGTRRTGKNSSRVSFENQFYDISLEISYLLNNALFNNSSHNRFYFYGYAGISSMWYDSYLYNSETLNTIDFEGFKERPETQGLSQKNLLEKDGTPQTFAIPVGFRVNYRVNYKMDIHLDYSITSTFTDRLDAFDRSWTADDKYSYVGLGITFNFNRTSDDAPSKREKQKNINSNSYSNENSSSASGNEDTIRSGILSRRKNKTKNNRNTEDDELLNVRLKLFETQLKLFEMQYLLGQ